MGDTYTSAGDTECSEDTDDGDGEGGAFVIGGDGAGWGTGSGTGADDLGGEFITDNWKVAG